MGWDVIAAPQRRGPIGIDRANSIVVSFEKAGGKTDRMAVAFRIGSQVAKSLRWQKGDRVVVVRDGVAIGLRRVSGKSTDGYSLAQATNGNALRFEMVNDDLMSVIDPCSIDDPMIEGDVVVFAEAKNKGGKK